MTDAILEILFAILPDSNVWKFLTIVVVLFTLTKYPWEWIGRGIRYLFRWVPCKVFNSHCFEMKTGSTNAWGQFMAGTVQCVVCGRIQHFSEVL